MHTTWKAKFTSPKLHTWSPWATAWWQLPPISEIFVTEQTKIEEHDLETFNKLKEKNGTSEGSKGSQKHVSLTGVKTFLNLILKTYFL